MTISKKTSAAPYPTARPDKTHFLSINPRLQGHTPIEYRDMTLNA